MLEFFFQGPRHFDELKKKKKKKRYHLYVYDGWMIPRLHMLPWKLKSDYIFPELKKFTIDFYYKKPV